MEHMDIAFNMATFIGIAQIIAIDILLGGDNAVLIALASRNLPEHQRKKAIFWGILGAIILRFIFVFCASFLLKIAFVKLVGALLLLWIGVKLVIPQDADAHKNVNASEHLISAIKTIIIADAVMSLDNVVGISAAANGHMSLVIFGIILSVPIIVFGSQLISKLMDRYPIIVILGGMLLGWIGGGIGVDDAIVPRVFGELPSYTHYIGATVGALFVLTLGLWLTKKQRAAAASTREPPLHG